MKPDSWLADRAGTVPARVALAASGEALSYAELDAAAAAEARRLEGEGIAAGAPLEIAMPAGLDYALRLHALIKLGAVACPVDPRLGDDERPQPAEPREGEGLGAVHCRILTSGTSAAARPVELTYSNHLWSAAGTGLALGVEPDDRWLCCVPLFHVSGLMILIRSLLYGTAAEIHDGFDPDAVAASLETGEVTLISLVATQLARLLEIGAELAKPRAIVLGGGPVPGELLEEALARGATAVQTYGMTETDSQVATLAPSEARRKAGSAGRPLLSAEIRITGEGEIAVRGPTLAAGTTGEDGWLHTGDLGRIDEEGYLHVTGRAADTIISGGENVMPAEVEAVLLTHPAVADAAVLGRPDPQWQEAVHAFVVLADGGAASEDELRAHAAASLAPFKVPKRIEFADALPRTATGKLLRDEIGEARG